MSPSPREIKGGRPAPLKIHSDSHFIHKTSSTTTTTASSSSTTTASSNQQQQQRHHHPVIIYTHAPKVIHTQAHDFMALVQKLTGLSHSPEDQDSSSSVNPPPLPPSDGSNNHGDERRNAVTMHDDDSSSSENCSIFFNDVYASCSSLSTGTAMSPISLEPLPPPDPFSSEMQLFTPSSSDFFCSTRNPFHRYGDSPVFSPTIANMGGAISPSIMDIMKAYNEY